ncbi:SRPBCC family protein [Rhodobacteraceae bacterium D3-12]|nr:SRPBCC family protein [Rhodobacteraceae bacterium D3-12]
MLFLRRAATLLLALVLLLVVVAYLLPRNVHVVRAIPIDAPPETVFPFVNSLKEGVKWSPWLSRDPNTTLAFSGPESGVGNALEWTSRDPQVSTGKQVITKSTPNSHVTTALDFGDMGLATARFTLTPAGTGTLISWRFDADMGRNPLSRWMGLMMDRWVGDDFEQGLANLKTLIENR